MQGNLDERGPVEPWCKMQMQSVQAFLAFALGLLSSIQRKQCMQGHVGGQLIMLKGFQLQLGTTCR